LILATYSLLLLNFAIELLNKFKNSLLENQQRLYDWLEEVFLNLNQILFVLVEKDF